MAPVVGRRHTGAEVLQGLGPAVPAERDHSLLLPVAAAATTEAVASWVLEIISTMVVVSIMAAAAAATMSATLSSVEAYVVAAVAAAMALAPAVMATAVAATTTPVLAALATTE